MSDLELSEQAKLLFCTTEGGGRVRVTVDKEMAENESCLFCLVEGELELMTALCRPLNRIVHSYVTFSDDPDVRYIGSVLKDLIESLKTVFDSPCFSLDLKEHDLSVLVEGVEDKMLALWVRSSILENTNMISNSLVKTLLKRGAGSYNYVLRRQSGYRFDVESFKTDHPDLYSKYLVFWERDYLYKTNNSRVFPLTEEQLRAQIDSSTKLVSSIMKK